MQCTLAEQFHTISSATLSSISLICSALLLTAGCTSSPLPRPQSTLSTPPAFAAVLRDDSGARTTVEFSQDGRALRRTPGVSGFYRGQRWRVVRQTARFELTDCDFDDEMHTEAETQHDETEVLLVRRAGHPDLMIGHPPEDGVYNSYDGRSVLIGVVGQHLMFEEHTGGYSCGAHGGSSAELRVVDLETHRVRTSLFTPGDAATLAPARARAFAALREIDADRIEHPDLLRPVSLRIDYTPAEPTVQVLLSAPSCYACGDGIWGSYTSSIPVEAQAPELIAPTLRAPPLPLRQWVEAHEMTLLGWSTLHPDSPLAPRPD